MRLRRILAAVAFGAIFYVNFDVLGALLIFLAPPPAGERPTSAMVEVAPGDRRVGPDRQLYRRGIYSMYLEGAPYARGYAAGLLAADLDLRLEAELHETFARAIPSALGRALVVRGAALGVHSIDGYLLPEQRLELRGFADAVPDRWAFLAPAYTRKVYYHAIHDIGQALVDSPLVEMACTGFMAGGSSTVDGHWLLARDFDFDGGSLFDIQKAVVFVKPETGIPFASISFAGFAGVMSGMNEAGIAIALQAGASGTPVRAGTPMTLIAREILQYARSLEDAREILDKKKGFVSENVLVVDGTHGEAALFEVSPDRVERLDVVGDLSVSNHFRSEALKEDPVNIERMAGGTTVARLARMEELVDRHRGELDPDVAVEILRDRLGVGDRPLPMGHRTAINADIATHSVIFDATARRIRVSIAPNASGGYVDFDLDAGLAGRINPMEAVPAEDLATNEAVHEARELVRRAKHARPVEAKSLAKRALDLVAGDVSALLEMARAEQALGELEAARAHAAQALATPPETAHQREVLEEIVGG